MKQAVALDPDTPVFADVEITHDTAVQMEVRLKKPETIVINPGFQVTVCPDRTFQVATPAFSVRFVFPAR